MKILNAKTMEMFMNVSKEESIRLHMDWWGKCRTCSYWIGTDEGDNPRWNDGKCTNSQSPLFEEIVSTEGYCPKWNSFDLETACEIMEQEENEEIEKHFKDLRSKINLEDLLKMYVDKLRSEGFEIDRFGNIWKEVD